MTFYAWFGLQRQRQDPIGDLARECCWDDAAPREKSYHLFAYLMRRRPRETREAARAVSTLTKKPPARVAVAPAERKRSLC